MLTLQVCRAPAGACRAQPPFRQTRQRSAISRRLVCSAEGGEGGDREMESAFEQELRRRGMDASTSGGGAPPRSASEEGGRQQRSAPRPPPSFRGAPDDTVPPQLAQSRALNSEGLEGFIPRAIELVKLGGSFIFAFAPFMIAVALGFGAVYFVFGDAFIHGGSPASGPPPYIDPDMLLAEPTADPMVPLDLR